MKKFMVTSFQKAVYSLIKKIPKGKVSTYAAIGKALGKAGQVYRAVGVALNRNRDKAVPCHRVVCSSGFVGSFNKGMKQKIKFLEREGIKVINDKIELRKYLFEFKTKITK